MKEASQETQEQRRSDKPRWSIRPYEEGDDHDLNQLHNEVFGWTRSLERWKWKFGENPATNEKILPVALINDRIVGMYPCLLGRWKIGNAFTLAAQPVETAVEPSARDPRLIAALHKLHVKQCEALGVLFSFGVPNRLHYKVGKRLLKYVDLLKIPIMNKPVNLRLAGNWYFHVGPLQPALSWFNRARYAFLRKTRRSIQARDVSTVTVTHFDERFDRLWAHASKSYPVIAMRDRRFLEWRYFKNPQKDFVCFAAIRRDEVVGYLILKYGKRKSAQESLIADVLALPEEGIVDALLHTATLWCLDKGIDYMRCAALEHTELYRALVRAGFRRKRRTLDVVYVFTRVDHQLFREPTNWYLTFGDFDSF